MLDQRLEDFSSLDELVCFALGLQSFGARVEALVAVPRADGGRAPDAALADFLLGVLSATRTLRATLGGAAQPLPAAPSSPEASEARPEERAAASERGILR